MPIDIEVFPLETPALRPLEIIPAEMQGKPVLVVRDPAGVIEGTAVIVPNPLLLVFMQMADGQTSCAEMASAVAQATGQIVGADVFDSLAKQLDEALLLQSERFRDALNRKHKAFLDSPVRPSTVFRAEGGDRLTMIKQLGDEFRRHQAGPKAPPPQLDLPRGGVKGILAPHIDYMRGGHGYAWAYRALKECGEPAHAYIVLGTCHNPLTHRFVATRKAFETPFGDVETDAELLEQLGTLYGGELFRDEHAHATEHTIELQAVYLRQLFGDGRTPKIVPVLVGSFDDLLENPASPRNDGQIGPFCAALRRILDEHDGRVGIIGGVDLSHCGPQFGDDALNDAAREQEIEAGDRAVLAAIEAGDPDGFFDTIRRDGNARNVCSVAPIYCVLEAMRGRAQARVLSYQQANSEDRTCLVSFTSVAFVRNGAAASGTKILIVPG